MAYPQRQQLVVDLLKVVFGELEEPCGTLNIDVTRRKIRQQVEGDLSGVALDNVFQTHIHHLSSEVFGRFSAEFVKAREDAVGFEHATHRADVKELEDFFVDIGGEVNKPARRWLRGGVVQWWVGH